MDQKNAKIIYVLSICLGGTMAAIQPWFERAKFEPRVLKLFSSYVLIFETWSVRAPFLEFLGCQVGQTMVAMVGRALPVCLGALVPPARD